MASLLGKKGYKAIRVINSKKKIQRSLLALLLLIHFIALFFFSFFLLHFFFGIYFVIGIDSFADNLCFFLVFHFFEFSCWLSSTNSLIWIFGAFVAFIEVVSL